MSGLLSRSVLVAILSLLAAGLLLAPPEAAASTVDDAGETTADTAAESTGDTAASGLDVAAVPGLARDLLPLITELTATRCPELPPVWLVAQVQAESGWDAGLVAAEPGGPAGLLQLDQRNWTAAGGSPWPTDPPGPGSDVTVATSHLRVAVPWVCANLRAVTGHLEATGKPTAPLDAMLVCHIAGCGRVTGSATGIPAPGEADCPERCVQVVHRYLAAVHANLDRFTAANPTTRGRATASPIGATVRGRATPTAWTGGATGCTQPDPTADGGCLTGAARHGLSAVGSVFGSVSDGPVIRSAGCWDEHAWNPRSDHPRGRACDLFATTPGRFAAGADLDNGWRMADWLRANAEPLQVRYLIWQGRFWDPSVVDQDSWGRRYTGGGVYDVRNPTGGHYDHVHISFRE